MTKHQHQDDASPTRPRPDWMKDGQDWAKDGELACLKALRVCVDRGEIAGEKNRQFILGLDQKARKHDGWIAISDKQRPWLARLAVQYRQTETAKDLGVSGPGLGWAVDWLNEQEKIREDQRRAKLQRMGQDMPKTAAVLAGLSERVNNEGTSDA